MNKFSPIMQKYFLAQMAPLRIDRQKALETFYLSQFLTTPTGQQWQGANTLVINNKQEHPDFLFTTPTGTKTGLEIAEWVNQTKECRTTQILYDIAREICKIFKTQRNINLSLIIDIYDPKRWETKTPQDFFNTTYHPGIKCLLANKREIKRQFLNLILNSSNLTERPEQKWITINAQHFKLSFSRSWTTYPEFFVNNITMCWDNPIQSIQKIIDEKNKKYNFYVKDCEKCTLLIVLPLYNTGNPLITQDNIMSYKFHSNFKNTYLLEMRNIDGPVVNKLYTDYL